MKYQGAGCADITPSTQNPVNPNTFVEMYNYSQAGLIVGNELLVSQVPYGLPAVTADLEATYSYDNEGKMTGMTYPSSSGSGFAGDNYTYTFDSLGRPNGLTDQTTLQTAVSGVTYGPAREMLTVHYGGVNETRTYNTLLQLTGLSAFNVGLGQTVFGRQYSYSGTNNNGKIQSETNTLSGEVVSYQYDALNRLIAATSNSATAPWGQSFAYDGFGNLTDKGVTSGSAPTYHATFNSATNRDNGASYDLNGNQTGLPGISLGYDVENRITVATPTGIADMYSYGRGNRRVYAAHWQWNGTKYDLITEKVYFYSVTGQKLGTYQLHLNTSPPGPPSLTFASVETRVWFGSKLVTLNGGAVTPDRLGSFGTYYPYGEDRGAGNPPADREKFATYTRDSATGLDYAVNRYYNSTSGRFLSADPHINSAGPTEPGSWNRYAYVGGDPINFVDPAGLARCTIVGVETTLDDNGLAVSSLATIECSSRVGSIFQDEQVPYTGDWRQMIRDAEANLGKQLDRVERSSFMDLLSFAIKRVQADLEKPDCAKDFKNADATSRKATKVGLSRQGQIQYIEEGGKIVANAKSPGAAKYNAFTGSINLNSDVDWMYPSSTFALLNGGSWMVDLQANTAFALGVSNVTSEQYMDLTILHELSHYNGAIGDPDRTSAVEKALWADCIN